MSQAVEAVSRKSITRECLINAAAAAGLLSSGALITLLWISLVLWFFGKFLWMW